MLSIQVSSLMNRKGPFHSLRTNTLKVPSLIFLVVTLGTFGRQPVEDLRVYVRGQKMIDSLGCREDWKTFSALETFRGLHYVATFSKTHILKKNLGHRQSQFLFFSAYSDSVQQSYRKANMQQTSLAYFTSWILL